jgi:hypothetical protein
MNKDIIENVKKHFSEYPYSRERWITHTESNDKLIPFLQSLNANLIIDVGCGTNPYKEHVNNVIGLDVGSYPEADINLSCEEVYDLNIFQPQCADAVLALGSINFGTWDDVVNQLSICVDWCRIDGYIVCRARLNDHTELNLKKGFVQYGWQIEDIYKITQMFSDRVEFYKEPVVETAAGGGRIKHGGHGKPDHDRLINLAVWYWKRK